MNDDAARDPGRVPNRRYVNVKGSAMGVDQSQPGGFPGVQHPSVEALPDVAVSDEAVPDEAVPHEAVPDEAVPDVAATDAPVEAFTDVRVVAVDTRSERRLLMRNLLEGFVPPAEIAEADSSAAAVALVNQFHPDLVVLEIQMPLEEGLDAITALRGISPPPRIVVCSFHRDAATMQGALDRGAEAYLTKPVNHTDLRPFLAASSSNS